MTFFLIPVGGACDAAELGLADDLGSVDVVATVEIGRSKGCIDGESDDAEDAEDPRSESSREFCRLRAVRPRAVGFTVTAALLEVLALSVQKWVDGEDDEETVIAASKKRGAFEKLMSSMRARAGLVWNGLDGDTTDGLVKNAASGSLRGVFKSLL